MHDKTVQVKMLGSALIGDDDEAMVGRARMVTLDTELE